MKTLSFWAKRHPRPAIVFIILLKVLLAIMAVYTGLLFTKSGVFISTGFLFVFALLFVSMAFVYERNGTIYFRRKFFDFVLACSAFCSLAIISNRLDSVNFSSHAVASTVVTKPTANKILTSLKYRDKKTLTRLEKRILKNEFKTQLKKYAVAKLNGDNEKAKQTWVIVLIIIGALGLIYLLTGLVCHLACSGADAAAIIVGLGGFVGIIWGTGALILYIQKKHKASIVKSP